MLIDLFNPRPRGAHRRLFQLWRLSSEPQDARDEWQPDSSQPAQVPERGPCGSTCGHRQQEAEEGPGSSDGSQRRVPKKPEQSFWQRRQGWARSCLEATHSYFAGWVHS